MGIRENLEILRKELPASVKLVAVSKTKSIAEVQEAYEAGQKIFGENKSQELAEKQMILPKDIEWHFIGHLQSNKVRQIAPFIHYIQSIDSLKLLSEVNREGQKNNRVINCLLQLYIATEDTKFGLDMDEVTCLLSSEEFQLMKNVQIRGVMGIATYSCDQEVIRREFRSLKEQFEILKTRFFSNMSEFNEISMGMTGDYMLAIAEGSTMVRIGTAIFGERKYNQF